jgi:hypothetical protein
MSSVFERCETTGLAACLAAAPAAALLRVATMLVPTTGSLQTHPPAAPNPNIQISQPFSKDDDAGFPQWVRQTSWCKLEV